MKRQVECKYRERLGGVGAQTSMATPMAAARPAMAVGRPLVPAPPLVALAVGAAGETELDAVLTGEPVSLDWPPEDVSVPAAEDEAGELASEVAVTRVDGALPEAGEDSVGLAAELAGVLAAELEP